MASNDTTDPIVDDLRAELDELAAMVDGLNEDDWRRPSACPGWSISDVLLHLAQTNEMATASVMGRLMEAGRGATWAGAGAGVDAAADAAVAAERGSSGSAVHGRWRVSADRMVQAFRDTDPSVRVRWVVGDMSPRSLATTRIAETWIHTGDIATGLDVAHRPTDRLRHVAFLVHRTLPYAFARAGLDPPQPVAFELTPPAVGAPWVLGDPEVATTVVRGPAHDLCRVAGQRAAVPDTALEATGPDAGNVLALMRTFA